MQTAIAISAIIIISACSLLFLKISIKIKCVCIVLCACLLGFTIYTYLPKKLSISIQNDVYMATKNGSKELIDESEKERLINIINNTTLYKGAKHHSFLQADVRTLNIVSDHMFLSNKKVKIAFFNLLKGETYGDVQIDYEFYYFDQTELY